MVDWNSSLKKPFLDIKNLVIGILLSILPVVRWFALGYALECSGLTKKKVAIENSPKWTDWMRLFFNGLLVTVISIIYLAPAFVLLLLGSLPVLATISQYVDWVAFFRGDSTVIANAVQQNWNVISSLVIMALPFMLFAVILALVGYYVLPAAVMNFLNYSKFKSAFELGKIFRKAFTSTYFFAWLLVMGISLIAYVLTYIPLVGYGSFFFIGSVIAYTVYGQVYREIKK